LAGGVEDFTDGKYSGNPSCSYEDAQRNQAEWLLDQIKCRKGSHILDIGCGNGRILKAARDRGAHAVGITISKQQIKRNKDKGLDAHLMNYRNIPQDWDHAFDGVIANGSVEHFVQVQDAIDGKQDRIYEEMFGICHRILRHGGYLATTMIHFNQPVDPHEICKGSRAHSRGSDDFHFAKVLQEDFGGWYPVEGQLKKCGSDYFDLEYHEDGTQDYHWTSEFWLSEMKRQTLVNPKVWTALLSKLRHKQRGTIGMLDNLIIAQSWMWQFRERENNGTPTKLFRDVWKRKD